jgi:hypothetical protein
MVAHQEHRRPRLSSSLVSGGGSRSDRVVSNQSAPVRFVPPVSPREWAFMIVRALAVIALSIGIVSVTVHLDAPAAVRWSVPTRGSTTAASQLIAQQLCSHVSGSDALTMETYALGAAIPTSERNAGNWIAGVTGQLSTAPADHAVVCVFHTNSATFQDQPLSSDVVIVIETTQPIRTDYWSSLPSQPLEESNVPPAHEWEWGPTRP